MLPKHALYIRCVRKGVRVHSVLQYVSAFRVLDGAEMRDDHGKSPRTRPREHGTPRNTHRSGQGLRRDGFGLKRKVYAL